MLKKVATDNGFDPQSIFESATSEKPGEPRKYVDISRAVYIYENRNSNPGQRFYIPLGGTPDLEREEACNILCKIVNGEYTNRDGSLYSNQQFEKDYFAWLQNNKIEE